MGALVCLVNYFPCTWCLVDGDGYCLSLLYGKGNYALIYTHHEEVIMELVGEYDIIEETLIFLDRVDLVCGISLAKLEPRIVREIHGVMCWERQN